MILPNNSNEFQNLAEAARAMPPATSARRAQSLYFPNDYRNIDHCVTFQVKKFERVTRTSALANDQTLVNPNRNTNASRLLTTITLPMPSIFNTEYGVEYDDAKQISSVGELAATMASMARGGNSEAAARSLGQALSQIYGAGAAAGGVGSAAQNAGNEILRQIQGATQTLTPGVAGAVGLSAAAGLATNASTSAQAVIANFLGVARNPHKVVLFQGVNFRRHVFSYKLSPKNINEARSIYKIIKAFKYHMSPSYGLGETPAAARGLLAGLGFEEAGETTGNITSEAGSISRAFFEYPEVFDIKFQGSARNNLFTIGESVLRGFTVNYHPMAYPAYVRSLNSPNVSSPAEVEISLTFQETDIVTKEQIQQFDR